MSKSEEEKAAYRRAWYAENRERVLLQQKEWRARNPERVKENNRKWNAANKDRVREYKSKYAEDNAAAVKARQRRWYVENREDQVAKAKARRAANSKKIRERNRTKKYGIRPHEWEQLFAFQGSRCAICKSRDSGSRDWHTDHCHDSGEVRGILCGHCNTGLGRFKDRADALSAAIEYLRDPPARSVIYA